MRKIILLVTVSLLVLPLSGQFTAVMNLTERENKKEYQVRSDGIKYRYDFEENGMKMIVIADPEANRNAILMPDKKFVLYVEPSSSRIAMFDPYQAFKQMRNKFSEKDAGTENVLGVETEKVEIYIDEDKVLTGWFSPELSFLVKSVNHGNGYMCELNDIEQKNVDAALFTIPEDYTEVDMKMRPVIPEPPAPTSWETINVNLPVIKEFERGDRIVFKIPDCERYKIELANEADSPSKIVRTTFKDGKELPEDKIGPASFRSDRLYGGETLSCTYYGEPGNEVVILVFEGKMKIEITPDE